MKTKHRKIKRTLTTPYRPLPKGERGGVELLLIHTVEHVGKQGQVVEVARQADLRKQAAELAKQSITIEANATEDGHLYGSVGAPDIVAALKNNDIHLSADQIRLEGPLKELGLYTVKIHLHHDIDPEAHLHAMGQKQHGLHRKVASI